MVFIQPIIVILLSIAVINQAYAYYNGQPYYPEPYQTYQYQSYQYPSYQQQGYQRPYSTNYPDYSYPSYTGYNREVRYSEPLTEIKSQETQQTTVQAKDKIKKQPLEQKKIVKKQIPATIPISSKESGQFTSKDQARKDTKVFSKTIKPRKANNQKVAFINKVLPIIIAENIKIKKDRQRLMALIRVESNLESLNQTDHKWLKQLAKRYKLYFNKKNYQEITKELKRRVNTINPAVAMSQAAIESGWGKSRFTREANNIFGIWTYNEKQGMIPKRRDPNKKHFIRVFDDLDESVAIYMNTLNTHKAYQKLRDIRAQKEAQKQNICDATTTEQANGLEKYSAKGNAYIDLVNKVIEQNDLIALSQSAIEDLNAESQIRTN